MKLITVLLSAALILPINAQAQFTGPGATEIVSTVKQAHKAADDTQVVLEGRILRQLDHDTYEFKDKTGTIKIEIDDEHLPSTKFNQNNIVRITGEVDKELTYTKIDVKMVEILK